MTVDPVIQEALDKKKASSKFAPCNLFEFAKKDLESHGYEQLASTQEIKDGDLLDMSNGTLWCVILSAAHTRKNLRRKEVGSLTILRKI